MLSRLEFGSWGHSTRRNLWFQLLMRMDILTAFKQLQRFMAVQLFNLRGVPEDEADEIRALLQEHAIDYYETPAGNWGMSMPSLWLKEEGQLEQARALIGEYQRQRQVLLQEQLPQRTLAEMVREHPVRYLAYLALIALILYLSISPFLKIGKL